MKSVEPTNNICEGLMEVDKQLRTICVNVCESVEVCEGLWKLLNICEQSV